MDRLEAMSILLAVVEAGSFSEAGRRLGMPLPTISRKIAELERHLKVRLLVRSTRRLSLTDAGAEYVAASRGILERIAELEARASGAMTSPRGVLTITAPYLFGRLHIAPLVNEFLLGAPQMVVELTFSENIVNLADEHMDLAIRIGALRDNTLVARRVGEVRRVVCGSPDYFAAHGVPAAPSELTRHACVTFSNFVGNTSWVFGTRPSSQEAWRPSCRLKVNSAEAAVEAAIDGVGLTHVLSYQAAQGVAQGKLKIVLEDFEPPPLPVHLVRVAQTPVPLQMRGFLEFAIPRLHEALSAMPRKQMTPLAKRLDA
jgi:DNA-binding transcriptional LysR family regulator